MRYRVCLLTGCIILAFAATNLSAFSSDEKTPEEQAADNVKKATESYNNAVKHIDRAKKIGEAGNASYSFDYRATPEEKARREFEKAVKDLQKAIELDSKLKEAHNNLGYCYRKLGKLPESLAAYDKAIALDSNFAQAREYRGETYLALERLTDAEHELAFLQSMKSEYAAQLERSIALYKQHESQESMGETGK